MYMHSFLFFDDTRNVLPYLCNFTGKAIEVFEHEQVTFYFCNEMKTEGLFFNVLCLEETGIATGKYVQ